MTQSPGVVGLIGEELLIPGGIQEGDGEGPGLDPRGGRRDRIRERPWGGDEPGRELTDVQVLPEESGRDDYTPGQDAKEENPPQPVAGGTGPRYRVTPPWHGPPDPGLPPGGGSE